jgi:GNAT superfamily N-acetyltransferase
MLEYKQIDEQSFEFVERLYNESFPINERLDLNQLIQNDKCDFIVFYDNDFIGFACMLTYKKITNIVYLAVDRKYQNKGYGTKILNILFELKKKNSLLVDIEKENINSINNEQRIRRKRFYYRNGFIDNNLSYTWRNETFELLVHGHKVSEQQIHEFWQNM